MFAILIAGLQAGAQYAILAAALVTVFATTRVVNFAVGFFGTVALYVAIYSLAAGLPPLMAIVVGCMAAVFASIIVEFLVAAPILGRLKDHGPGVVLIATLLVWLTGEGLIRIAAGPQAIAMPRQFRISGIVVIAGNRVSVAMLATLAIAGVVLVVTGLLLYRTRVGLATRAVMENPSALTLLGDYPRKYRIITWGFAGLVAAIAGFLIAQSVTPAPGLTNSALIKATAGAALGGISSLPGAVVGALTIGVLEAFAVILLGSWAAMGIPLVLICAVILVRPQGLFGRAEASRV